MLKINNIQLLKFSIEKLKLLKLKFSMEKLKFSIFYSNLTSYPKFYYAAGRFLVFLYEIQVSDTNF